MIGRDDPGFAALAERIVGRSGLDVAAYKDRCLRRRIASRMRACGARSYEDYVAFIDRQPEELERLLDALTINVTKFFRNPETWEWLGRHVLPDLLEDREGRVRAWSAGCASGEEPYTLVMLVDLVLERLGRTAWLNRLRVDATDIDRASLERARAARYHVRAFSEAAPEIARRYCLPVDEEHLDVRPDIRARVDISRFDLTGEERPEATYDLVVCRNVVIYFDREIQERLMNRFADALVPGGVLVLGKVETIMGTARTRFELLEPRERIYRKAA